MSTEQKSSWQILTQLLLQMSNQNKKTLVVPSPQWRRLLRRRVIFWICVLLMTIGVGVYLRAEIHRRVSRISNETHATLAKKGGTLSRRPGAE